MNKKLYTVSVTFDTQGANNPLDAAKKACKLLMSDGDTFIYDVMDEETGEKFTVDLSEDDEDAVLPNND
jgi:translation elongation factor P/translation initiation factor 5A